MKRIKYQKQRLNENTASNQFCATATTRKTTKATATTSSDTTVDKIVNVTDVRINEKQAQRKT